MPCPICCASRLPDVAMASFLSLSVNTPPEAKVRLSWSSKSTRSVTIITRHCARASSHIRAFDKNTIVNDLPLPVVCQITPPSREPDLSNELIRSINALIPNTCWYRATIFPAFLSKSVNRRLISSRRSGLSRLISSRSWSVTASSPAFNSDKNSVFTCAGRWLSSKSSLS